MKKDVKYYHISMQYYPNGFVNKAKQYPDTNIEGEVFKPKRTSVSESISGCIDAIIEWHKIERLRIKGVRFVYYYLYEAVVPEDVDVISAKEVYDRGYIYDCALTKEAFILGDTKMEYVGYIKYGTSVKNRRPVLLEYYNTKDYDEFISVKNIDVRYAHPRHRVSHGILRNTIPSAPDPDDPDDADKYLSTNFVLPAGDYYGLKTNRKGEICLVRKGKSIDGMFSAKDILPYYEYHYLKKMAIEEDIYTVRVKKATSIGNYTHYANDLGVIFLPIEEHKDSVDISPSPTHTITTDLKPNERYSNGIGLLYRSTITPI